MYQELVKCIVCGKDLEKVVDLGEQYVVDFVPEKNEKLLKAPLALMKCKECSMVQLQHRVSPDRLYKKFWYRSGINEQMKNELLVIVRKATDTVDLKDGDKVLDIGSNDGTLLGWYPKGITTFGIDPCTELVKESMANGSVDIGVDDYFSAKAIKTITDAFSLPTPKFKIITAISMFYDVETPVQFLKDCKTYLHNEGVLIIQMNYLKTMLEDTAFDNISHEHLAYYSVTTLKKVVELAGLELQGVEQSSCNGGSIRAYITHKSFSDKFCIRRNDQKLWMYTKMSSLLLAEEKMGLSDCAPYINFMVEVDRKCRKIASLLSNRKELDHVYFVGASTRGTVLTQVLAKYMDLSIVQGVADRDRHKTGLRMVGTWLPIVSEETFRESANIGLVLPWHFKESIVKRESEWINRRGGKLIFPLPEPHVMESILDTEDAVAVRKG